MAAIRNRRHPGRIFWELGIALDSEGPCEDAKERATKFKAYAKILTLGGTTTKILGKTMATIGVPGGPVVEYVGTGIETAGETVHKGSDALDSKHEAAEKSLEAQKRELAGLLANLPRPVLIVIDDIDRLSTEEILQVFQLVKANADFPRLIYLLLFDREIVAKALDVISAKRGREFLEKIIQVGYHIPHASPATVHKVLFNGLNKFLEQPAIAKHWEKQRWLHHYPNCIAPYFLNLRHVYRFLASFSFHAEHHQAGRSFEVNPLDLILLETLRVFEPSVFEALPGAKMILTRYQGLFRPIKQEVVEACLAQLLSSVPSTRRIRVQEILEALFPGIGTAYGGRDGTLEFHDEWLRELRICHPKLFDKYFTLAIPDDDLSQAEFDELLSCSADPVQFGSACQALQSRGLLVAAFGRLEAYRRHIPIEHMGAVIEALCNISDSFPPREPGFLSVDAESYAWRLAYFGLKRENNKRKRFEILEGALSRSNGIVLPIQIVSLDERVRDREQKGHEFLVDESDLEKLKQICLVKMRAASKKEWFRAHAEVTRFLWRWSHWASYDEVRAWVAEHTKTADGAIWLLTVFLGETHSYGSDPRVRYYIKLSIIERFAEVEHLERLVGGVNQSKLSMKESRALREFYTALQRRRLGQSEEDIERSGDEGEIVG